jgi:hypothetical protein
MDVTKQMLAFLDILNINIEKVESLLRNNNLDEDDVENTINNWIQFNWESLVEKIVCSENEFLEYYGEGADYYNEFYRVTYSTAEPTHKIVCRSISGDLLIDLLSEKAIDVAQKEFVRFLNFDGYYYSNKPIFKHLMLDDDNGKYIVKICDVIFHKQVL